MPHVPKVSVVVTTYQRADLLRRALSDLQCQSLADFEVIIVDDGSTDHTGSVVRGISDTRFRYVRKPHIGVPAVVNAGIVASAGEYIMICHDHDVYSPTMLEKFSACLDRHPSAAFCFCGYVLLDASATIEVSRDLHDFAELIPGREFLVEQLLPRLDSCVSALSMIRRSALAGEYLDPRIGGCADVELWHRLAASWDVAYIKEPLIKIRGRDASSSFSDAALELLRGILATKDRYLRYAGDAREQRIIRRGWRRAVDAIAFSHLLKELAYGSREALPTGADLIRSAGTPEALSVLRFLALTPRPLSIALLKGLRAAHRRWRGRARLGQ
jgi:glycosyltransferase involved in cell wall biosynthesis